MKLRNKKTGKVYTLSDNLFIEYTQGGRIELRVIIPGGNMSYYYDSLAELNEEWEDYKPAEPLIKDEKTRKAVRAWAKANGAWLLLVVSSYRIEISQVDAEILFNDPVFKDLPRDRQLTVEELCGEEEE